jgi:hypothetical protein
MKILFFQRIHVSIADNLSKSRENYCIGAGAEMVVVGGRREGLYGHQLKNILAEWKIALL